MPGIEFAARPRVRHASESGRSQGKKSAIPIARLNADDSEDRPVVSPDGLTLVFSAARPGGIGASDLRIGRRADSKADRQPPVHSGDQVNTAEFDAATQILADGKTIVVNRKALGDPLLERPQDLRRRAEEPVGRHEAVGSLIATGNRGYHDDPAVTAWAI